MSNCGFDTRKVRESGAKAEVSKVQGVPPFMKYTYTRQVYKVMNLLGGGFKYFLFSSLFGEMIQLD